MQWESVIGLETHVQLKTKSKIFSDAPTLFGKSPNTQISAVDLALPGTLPVLNQEVVVLAIRLGCAIGAKVSSRSVFARKNYFYPDLPKGYQISQYEEPILVGGGLVINVENKQTMFDNVSDNLLEHQPRYSQGKTNQRWIRITRAHLEEDAGKSIHTDYGVTGIDLNRAGVPLLEVVTEPDIRSAKEASAYARALHSLVVWLGICDGNLQEGSFRCDANVSVRPLGSIHLGTRCEIKNLNSFRFLELAIDYEIQRQIALCSKGESIRQETRLYDSEKNETRSMRSKEDAQDYRYFPDPDLPELLIDTEWVEDIRSKMPVLPGARREHWIRNLSLSEYDADLLVSSKSMADYFDAALKELTILLKTVLPVSSTELVPENILCEPSQLTLLAKQLANWINADLSAAINRDGVFIDQSRVTAVQLARLVFRIQDGSISGKMGKELFAHMWSQELPDSSPDLVDKLIVSLGLRQICDFDLLDQWIQQAIALDPKSVSSFRSGNERALNALVGKVMKASSGCANPQQVADRLRMKLSGS